MRQGARSFVAIALALMAYLAVSAAPGSGHPADPSKGIAPHWSCRASATYANLVGNGSSGHVEPGAANGNATTGADSDQCQSNDALFPNPTVDEGNDSGRATEEAPFAKTRINNDFSYKQTPTASAGV